jgi:hypothetical protein
MAEAYPSGGGVPSRSKYDPRMAATDAVDRSLTHSVRMPDLVRVGSPFDGGYVVPAAALARCDAILGLGVHADWSFEADALARSGARLAHLYDATTTRAWLWSRWPWGFGRVLGGLLSGRRKRVHDGLSRLAAPFRYGRFFRGGVRHVPAMIGARTAPGVVAIADALASLRAEGATRILLKMDIEGGEYEVLDGIDRWGDGVALLVAEFHGIDADPARFNRLLAAIGRRFVPVHLHGNNSAPCTADGFPGMVEITFVDRALAAELLASELRGAPLDPRPFDYPIPALDRPCSLRGPEVVFRA